MTSNFIMQRIPSEYRRKHNTIFWANTLKTNKFFSFRFISWLKRTQKNLPKTSLFSNCTKYCNNKWVSMHTNGRREICSSGITSKYSTGPVEDSQETDYSIELRVDLIEWYAYLFKLFITNSSDNFQQTFIHHTYRII